MEPTFFVICRLDDNEDGTPGEYVLATRQTFATRELADKYASTVAPGRVPIVAEAPRGMTRPATGIEINIGSEEAETILFALAMRSKQSRLSSEQVSQALTTGWSTTANPSSVSQSLATTIHPADRRLTYPARTGEVLGGTRQ